MTPRSWLTQIFSLRLQGRPRRAMGVLMTKLWTGKNSRSVTGHRPGHVCQPGNGNELHRSGALPAICWWELCAPGSEQPGHYGNTADFAHSDIENSGNGTTYGFYFTISAGPDYLNISEGSTGTIEGFYITTETYTTGTPPIITPTSTVGPLLYNDTDGISLSFAAAGNYYVTINLLCGDQTACTTAADPSHDISLTSSASYQTRAVHSFRYLRHCRCWRVG